MAEYTQCWEQWVGSTARPVEQSSTAPGDQARWPQLDHLPRRNQRPQRHRRDARQRADKHCDHGRHDHCAHRLGGPAEGGVVLKLGLPGFLWRCGCPCHNDPHRAGRLF